MLLTFQNLVTWLKKHVDRNIKKPRKTLLWRRQCELLGLPTTVAALTRARSGGATTWVPFYKLQLEIRYGFLWYFKWIPNMNFEMHFDRFQTCYKTSATTGLFLLQVMQPAMMLSVERRKLSQRFTFANLDFIFQQHAQHDPCRSERKMSKEKLLSNCSIKLC